MSDRAPGTNRSAQSTELAERRDPGRSRGAIEERLNSLDAMVRAAASETAHLWRDEGLAGAVTAQLIEVSHALHRAALALDGVDLIGQANSIAARSGSGSLGPRDGTDDAVLTLDPIGTVVSWNAGAQRIEGYTADEILGRHFSVRFTGDDISADQPQRELAHAVEHGRCCNDGWRVRNDGTRFWAHVVLTPLFGADDDLQGFAKVIRDETARRRSDIAVGEGGVLSGHEHLDRGLSATIADRILDAGRDVHSALTLFNDHGAVRRIEHAAAVLDGAVNDLRLVVRDQRGS